MLNVNLKNLDIEQQHKSLLDFNILPLALRHVFRFNTFLFKICKTYQNSLMYLNIFSNLNCRDNLILPRCSYSTNTDCVKFSFSFISIKILNLYLRKNLTLSKSDFLGFLKNEIVVAYNKTFSFLR